MNTLLITGANRGIGLEMVKQYTKDNWRVLACCRTLDKAEELHQLKQNNARIEIFQLDVSQPTSITSLANQIKNEPIDILMNSAGLMGPHNQNFGFTDPAAWLEVFKVNAMAPLLLAEALINNIANSQLRIIANMDSTMGSIALNTSGGSYVYRSTKTALNAVTKSMAIDLKDRNIKVIALHPGWVKTDMGGPNALITPEESVKGLRAILSQASMTDSGTFIGYNGDRLAW
jgi:NAD(P)-dependent dehydrogenase (short-subunit alcohol dehydrogenase family)